MRTTPWILALALVACGKATDSAPSTSTTPGLTDSGTTETETEVLFTETVVTVTLDGTPTEGIAVSQGGGALVVFTNAGGQVTLPLDPTVVGAQVAIAAHPDARTQATVVEGALTDVALVRFDRSDNLAYEFDHPGTPDDRGDTGKCGHCHRTLDDEWSESAHRGSASNRHVQDIYAGTAALGSQADCTAAGGQWWTGLEPGTGAAIDRCYLGAGTLPDLNPGCGDTAPCDGVATETGACADCHAPGIDGVLGGRDLLEAQGNAYEFGVHCDVCHKVESVDLSQPAGVGGRLQILRPSEEIPTFGFEPLTFGPYGDVANPRMGAVGRDHYTDTTLCAGCHEHDQAVLVPGETADPVRWPTGELPVHTTWSEWFGGPMNPGSPCQSCHMPPNPEAGNAADLYNVFGEGLGISVTSGWPRPPGAVRRHLWTGPRSSEGSDMLALAASVDLDPRWEGTEWVVDATVTNVACGHGLPTGEPSRQVLLAIEADCSGVPLVPTGGDVLPDYAGALDRQDSAGDWTVWPGAQIGDRIRVVSRPGSWRDYPGYGPFGDGTFDAAGKGVPVETWAGEQTVTAVVGDVVTLDGPLPAGDLAYRVPAAVLPSDGAPLSALAGAPGYGFARVLVDGAGNRMVPHHAAVDVVSDHRLLPQQSWTSEHRFDGTSCPTPTVRAVLVHRAFPYEQAAERAWTVTDSVMVEVAQ